MSFFDRFKNRKKTPEQEPPAPVETPEEDSAGASEPAPEEEHTGTPGPAPDPDTIAILLLSRHTSWRTAAELIEQRFRETVVSVDLSKPNAPAMSFQIEGFDFFCSYMAMPHPTQVCDLQAAHALASEEERNAMLDNQAFLFLAQKGGGASLEAKRRVCRIFTQLSAALMELDSALGLYANAAELLISRRFYLQQAEALEQNLDDAAYFPFPVWVSVRRGQKGGHQMLGTWGLKQFGFRELWFLNPSAGWDEVFKRLCILANAEIIGRELYGEGDTIQFSPGVVSTFKELQGALFIVEEHE